MPETSTTTTGAEKVRWNLSDLFASPDDPRLEASLAHELERAKAFEVKYKGKVATLEPTHFAAMTCIWSSRWDSIEPRHFDNPAASGQAAITIETRQVEFFIDPISSRGPPR